MRHASLFTASGDSTTLVFNILHGCPIAPYFISAEASTPDALGTSLDSVGSALMSNVKTYTITADGTNITITYPYAPQTGTNNLVWYWSAECN